MGSVVPSVSCTEMVVVVVVLHWSVEISCDVQVNCDSLMFFKLEIPVFVAFFKNLVIFICFYSLV